MMYNRLDHTRLDVLLSAARKDVEEWASLTLQLIENAFNNAENTYLSNLWPTPPASPRLETVKYIPLLVFRHR